MAAYGASGTDSEDGEHTWMIAGALANKAKQSYPQEESAASLETGQLSYEDGMWYQDGMWHRPKDRMSKAQKRNAGKKKRKHFELQVPSPAPNHGRPSREPG